MFDDLAAAMWGASSGCNQSLAWQRRQSPLFWHMYFDTKHVERLAHAAGRRTRVSLFPGISLQRYNERSLEMWEHTRRGEEYVLNQRV